MKHFISEKDICQILKLDPESADAKVDLIMNLLSINKLNSLYDEISENTGLAFIDKIIERLDIKYDVCGDYTTIVPEHGPFIIISNHPLGGIDGLILLKIISRIRPDFKIQGNFILTNIEPLRDYILPVNPFERLKSLRSSYKGLRGAYEHLAAGNCLGIFPAGEVSSFQGQTMGISDREWQLSAIRMIRSAGVQIIPVFFDARNSMKFYFAGVINPLFRTALLPSEIMKSRNRRIRIFFGTPVKPDKINSFSMINDLSKFLRTATYSLNQPSGRSYNFLYLPRNNFLQSSNIADPVNPKFLQSEIDSLPEECLLLRKNSFLVFCSNAARIPNILREIGRLREITFRAAGEGTNKSMDTDRFDIHYYHLFIWDQGTQQIAGAYRIGHGKEIMSEFGQTGFYISSLFRIQPGFSAILSKSAELGRSFIIKEYQKQHFTLLLLWKGVYQFLRSNPELRYIIGPVSISQNCSQRSKSLIVDYISRFHFDPQLALYIKPRKQFNAPRQMQRENTALLENTGNDIRSLEKQLASLQPGFEMPVLLKKYIGMNGKIISFNIDANFNNCLDALMIADIKDLPFEMRIQLSKETILQSKNRWSALSLHNMKQVYS
jgi:putative hemolysin